MKNLKINSKALVVLDSCDDNILRASRNIAGITTTNADTINVYDIITHDKFIITKTAIERVQEVFA